jgi:dienelactone hydrolase
MKPHVACLLCALGLTAVLFSTNFARADDPKPRLTRLITASDLAQQAEHPLSIPADGSYLLKIWTPAREHWSLNVEGSRLTLASRVDGDDIKPGWKTLGTVALKAGTLKISVAEPKQDEKAKDEKPKDEKSKDEKPKTPPPPPLPACLAISDDPNYDPTPFFELARGDLDTTGPSADTRRTHSRSNQQGNNFKAPENAQAWLDRAKAVREQLLVSLGLWPLFPKTPLHPRIVGKLERDGYTIEKVVIETFPGFFLAGNLYRPTEKPGKLPLMLCPHGHWQEGRVNTDVQRRCIQWAKLGCVVFMYDMVGYADSKPFGHVFLNNRLRLWGLSLPGLQTWNSIRALDWLTSLPDVDPARVACTGESGGGTQTFLLTAIDDRIKISAPIVMVSDWFQGGCVCENCAGLRIGTDNIEFAALTAPRPLKLVGATGDWTSKTMTHAYPAIRGVYDLVGQPDKISAEVFDYPHNYNMTSRNAVYATVARWLLGIEDSDSTKEGELRAEDPKDLYAFTSEMPAPPNLKTAHQLEDDLIKIRSWELDSLAPGSSGPQWEAARSLLLTSLRVRVGLAEPPPAEIESTEVRRLTLQGVTVIHSRVGRKGAGDKVPVVRLIPTRPTGRLTVIANRRGKASLGTLSDDTLALVHALLDRGQSVVGFDPLFVGEAFDPVSRATKRPDVTHFETYNPTVAADQMQDLATVLAWAKSQPDVREVSLIGQGLAGRQVLLARPLLQVLARTAIDLEGSSEPDGTRLLPAELNLPGLLQFGGFRAAAALTAPSPLWIYRTGKAFDSSWPEKAYALGDVSHVLRLDPKAPTPGELAKWIDAGE